MAKTLWESLDGEETRLTLTTPTRIEVDEPSADDMEDVEAILIEKVANVIIRDLGLDTANWSVTVNRGTSSSTIRPGGYRVNIHPQTRVDC